MIIAIEVNSVRTYLAGNPDVSDTTFAHAQNFRVTPSRLRVTHKGTGWPSALHRDLGNLEHSIHFSTAREFSTYQEAETFMADLGSLPVSGTLILLSPSDDGTTAAKRQALNAVGSVEPESITGVYVKYGFTFVCGALTTEADESFVTHLVSPEGDALVSPEGDAVTAPPEA